MDGTVQPIMACCDPAAAPDQPNACTGTESLENPMSCTETGNTVTYKLTVLEVADSCNTGYDLDGYDGQCCFPGGLTPSEGLHGVDNALSGLAPEIEAMGGNLGSVNQTFSDGLCGLTDDCSRAILPIEIRFEIDANLDEGCANLNVISGARSSNVILNLGDRVTDSGECADGGGGVGGNGGSGGDGGDECTTDADCAGNVMCEGVIACASGFIGTIPLTIADHEGELGNAILRMTVSEDGFSHGLLGAILDEEMAVVIAEASAGDADFGAVVRQAFDIRDDLLFAPVLCNALSTTLEIGGVAERGE